MQAQDLKIRALEEALQTEKVRIDITPVVDSFSILLLITN
jgi:hypothetical protein